ncbi:MAG: TetR/AcrR family transcriptional regulator [Candidatus Limivicinus sp.]|jgi:TetR/AcrR family transcriptional regulator
MNEIFARVSPEKRNRILNSALDEFAEKGFELASTNEIVENAGISKGLLFHYFGNKQKLYDYLIEFSYDYVTKLLENGIDWGERDFFKRAEKITSLKLSAMQEYPRIYDFLKKAMEKLSMEYIRCQFPSGLTEITERVYTENIDDSLFRSDLDLDRAKEIIRWTVEGAAEKLWKNSPDDIVLENAIEEHREYMNMLRTLMYK